MMQGANLAATFQLIGDLRGMLDGIVSNGLGVRMAGNPATAFGHGSNSAIGTTAVQLVAVPTSATLGVEVKAASENEGSIYIGNSDVTAASTDATDGIELEPGESILVRVDDVSKIYAVAAGGKKKPKPRRVSWLAV